MDLLKDIENMQKTIKKLQNDLEKTKKTTASTIESFENQEVKDFMKQKLMEASKGELDIDSFIKQIQDKKWA